MKRLETMLDDIRIQINKNRHCMIKDGASILPLCIVPYYGDNEVDSSEFAHKAPVLLDCFYENYKFEWDLTTKRVSDSKYSQDFFPSNVELAECSDSIKM